MTTISQRVIATAELLESILAQLPMRDLLKCQGVCRAWKTTIDSSPRLQEALFFKPSSVTRASPLSPPEGASPTLTCNDFQRNPLLESKFWPFFSKPTDMHHLFGEKDLLCMPWNKDELSRAAYNRAGASWRKMLLIQPASAIKDIELINLVQGGPEDSFQAAEEYIDPVTKGLRMGWVYDRCRAQAIDHMGQFMLRWQMLKSNELWAPRLIILQQKIMSCLLWMGEDPEEWAAMKSQDDPGLQINYRAYDEAVQGLYRRMNWWYRYVVQCPWYTTALGTHP